MMTIVIIYHSSRSVSQILAKVWRFLNIASTFRDIEVERASGGGFRLSTDEKAEDKAGEGRRGREDPEGAIGGRIRRE